MNKPANHIPLLVAAILASILTACSQQAWYQGARSAQTAQCMKQPLSEYEDCNEQGTQSYESYQEKRQQLSEEENKSN